MTTVIVTNVVIQARKDGETQFEVAVVQVSSTDTESMLEIALKMAKEKWKEEDNYVSYKADIKK